MRANVKKSFTHYYVQALEEGKQPMLVVHSEDKETGEQYHKFLDRKKALELAKAEKAITPEVKFRVMKCVEIYQAGEWL